MNSSNKKMVSKGRRKKEKIKAAQHFAEKAVNAEDAIQDMVREKAVAVKDSAILAAQKTDHFVKGVYGKAEDVKNDIKDGLHNISQDIHGTAQKISNDIKESAK